MFIFFGVNLQVLFDSWHKVNYLSISDNEIPKDKDLSQRKCTPMTTNSKCYYNGRKIVSYSDEDNNNTRIVGGGETSAHEYPFMVRILNLKIANLS